MADVVAVMEAGRLLQTGRPEEVYTEPASLAVARFLNGGGRVEEVPKDFRADPPRRPENNYGRGSI